VYSIFPYVGRGGWTWYTGSASWMYRLGTEMLLGVQRTGDRLQIQPHLPDAWPEVQIDYRFGKSLYHIRVVNHQSEKKSGVSMDGKALNDGVIPLRDDGQTHEIVVHR
jgi:cellobiose phosphorylase